MEKIRVNWCQWKRQMNWKVSQRDKGKTDYKDLQTLKELERELQKISKWRRVRNFNEENKLVFSKWSTILSVSSLHHECQIWVSISDLGRCLLRELRANSLSKHNLSPAWSKRSMLFVVDFRVLAYLISVKRSTFLSLLSVIKLCFVGLMGGMQGWIYSFLQLFLKWVHSASKDLVFFWTALKCISCRCVWKLMFSNSKHEFIVSLERVKFWDLSYIGLL